MLIVGTEDGIERSRAARERDGNSSPLAHLSSGGSAPVTSSAEPGLELVEDLGGSGRPDTVAPEFRNLDHRIQGANAAGGLELDLRWGDPRINRRSPRVAPPEP